MWNHRSSAPPGPLPPSSSHPHIRQHRGIGYRWPCNAFATIDFLSFSSFLFPFPPRFPLISFVFFSHLIFLSPPIFFFHLLLFYPMIPSIVFIFSSVVSIIPYKLSFFSPAIFVSHISLVFFDPLFLNSYPTFIPSFPTFLYIFNTDFLKFVLLENSGLKKVSRFPSKFHPFWHWESD